MEFRISDLQRIDRIAAATVIITTIILLVSAAAILRDSRNVNEEIQKEDGVLENLTFLFFGTAGVIFLVAMLSGSSPVVEPFRDYRVILILLGLLCIFAALEEISFGQRIFGWGSPEYFEEHSTQKETDFHNFPTMSIVFGIAAGVMAVYGVVVPFAMRWYPERFGWLREIHGTGIIYPPVQAALVFGLGILCIIIDYSVKLITGERFVANEYQEYLFGLGFLLFSLYLNDIRFQRSCGKVSFPA